MKYERFHQTIKGFTKHSNFIDVCKSISEKYLTKLELENSGVFEFSSPPLAQLENIKFTQSGGIINSVFYHGYEIRNSVETFLFTKSKRLINVRNITVDERRNVHIHGDELLGVDSTTNYVHILFVP